MIMNKICYDSDGFPLTSILCVLWNAWQWLISLFKVDFSIGWDEWPYLYPQTFFISKRELNNNKTNFVKDFTHGKCLNRIDKSKRCIQNLMLLVFKLQSMEYIALKWPKLIVNCCAKCYCLVSQFHEWNCWWEMIDLWRK